MAKVIDIQSRRKPNSSYGLANICNDSDLDKGVEDAARRVLQRCERNLNCEHSRREQRKCTIHISFNELRGVEGVFVRYVKNGIDFCITFSKLYDKSGVKRCLESRPKKVPWKDILQGKDFSVDVVLADYFIERVESGYLKNVLYFDNKVLDRAAFKF